MRDIDLRQDVVDALNYEPGLDAANIAVSVEDGVVVLAGHVMSYRQKSLAEDCVTRVHGVRGIAEEIEVRPVGHNTTSDDEIARRVLNTLNWNTSVPHDRIQVKVEEGRVTLSGDVHWAHERATAGRVVFDLAGVHGVFNQIVIVPPVRPKNVRERIEKALGRSARKDATSVSVNVMDDEVTLFGRVHSWAARAEAERAAWSGPGVTDVRNRIEVAP